MRCSPGFMFCRFLSGALLLSASCQPAAVRAVASPAQTEQACPEVPTTHETTTEDNAADGTTKVAEPGDVEKSPEAESETTPVESSRPWENPQIEIESFDCVSSWEHKAGELLRSNRGGGPGGAAWNWYGGALVCTVQVASNCSGNAVVMVRAGRDYESAVVVAVGPLEDGVARSAKVDFEIAAHHWERELRRQTYAVYETLLLVTHVSVRCPGPVGFTPETIDLTESFVGRFSGGE